MAVLRRMDDHAEPRPVIGDPLSDALANLHWSVERGEWSAAIKPEGCQALLDHIAELEAPSRIVPLLTKHGYGVHTDTARALAEQRAREQERDAVGVLAVAGATGALLGIVAAAARR